MSATKEIKRVKFTATGTPEGLAVSTSGEVTGMPTGEAGDHPVTVEVSTNYGRASGSVMVAVEGTTQEPVQEPESDPENPESESENP